MGLPDATTASLRGVAIVNATHFNPEADLGMLLVYDHSVRVSTQGHINPKKRNRMLAPAEQSRIPLMLYAEGGGGRPADTDRLDMTCSSRLECNSRGVPVWSLTAEFGGMELEGCGRLDFRKDMEAIADSEREDCRRKKVAEFCANETVVSVASVFEIDIAIDPGETRRRIKADLRLVPMPPARTSLKCRCINVW
ncbi:hypothetical protein [Mesorhizobium australicum]|uniref:hypothetical protein n=1 Tax=Mesorhizobium australicum TaxID=536018 RepID=UPI003EBE7014